MTPIPLQPNMPMPTDYSGDPVPPKQYYRCPHCKEQSPLTKDWVGLTDGEMEDTFIQCGGRWNGDFWEIEDADFHPFLRSIEAKLKELNT